MVPYRTENHFKLKVHLWNWKVLRLFAILELKKNILIFPPGDQVNHLHVLH
jgi:hypothetical protein